jgi:hypothetical protein
MSPYRKVITPILNYIWQLEAKNPKNSIAVLIPQLVESRWYYSFLHNRRAAIVRTVLLLKGRNRIVIVDVPWNLEKELPTKIADRRALRDRVRARMADSEKRTRGDAAKCQNCPNVPGRVFYDEHIFCCSPH